MDKRPVGLHLVTYFEPSKRGSFLALDTMSSTFLGSWLIFYDELLLYLKVVKKLTVITRSSSVHGALHRFLTRVVHVWYIIQFTCVITRKRVKSVLGYVSVSLLLYGSYLT